MKKIILIPVLAVVLIIALALSFYFFVLQPRNELDSYIKQSVTDVGAPAQQYNKFDIAYSGETIEVSNGNITLKLPAKYVKQDISMDRGEFYKAADENVTVIMPFSWDEEFDLTTAKDYDVEANITAEEVVKGFQSIWGITPDCAYNTIKCAYLTEKDCYNFWDINSQKAYIVSATLKNTLTNREDILIYEKGDICGFVSWFERTDSEIKELQDKYGEATKYVATLEIFTKNDLNSSNTILVKANSLDEVFAIMNSAEAVKG